MRWALKLCRETIHLNLAMGVNDMYGFTWNLMMCTLAGSVLAVLFLNPAGAVTGALGGLFVGAFVGWGNLKAQRVPVNRR